MRRTHTAIIAVAMTIAAAISGQPSAGAADSAPTTVTTPPRIVDADHPVSRVGAKVPIESLQRLKARPAKTPTLPTLTEHGQVTAKRTGATYERNLDHYKDGVPSGRMDVAYDPVNDCRAFLDSKVGKKVVDRFRYCSVSRWTYNHVEVATGRVLGTATYLQTIAGQAPQDRREIYYMVNLGFFDIQGTVPKTGPLEVSGISSGYRGADGSNVACEVTNSATNPQMLGQCLANGNVVATIVFDQNKSLGYGRDFLSRCGVATSTCVGKYCGEFTDADTSIRFDSASYLEGASGGVFDAAAPKILYDPRSAAHGAVATQS
ncbi:hypothetical protein GCM10010272_67530 [Streptomyces lateritius]|nr:hypothetical protein GCM10010272_67530 [Streptomyces lateritius]